MQFGTGITSLANVANFCVELKPIENPINYYRVVALVIKILFLIFPVFNASQCINVIQYLTIFRKI